MQVKQQSRLGQGIVCVKVTGSSSINVFMREGDELLAESYANMCKEAKKVVDQTFSGTTLFRKPAALTDHALVCIIHRLIADFANTLRTPNDDVKEVPAMSNKNYETHLLWIRQLLRESVSFTIDQALQGSSHANLDALDKAVDSLPHSHQTLDHLLIVHAKFRAAVTSHQDYHHLQSELESIETQQLINLSLIHI
eukprot:TRINITY_DN11300_c0_g1_i3.p1 TRINITY_DN11300_c0_g1~~TRINITY_DN11300_c0_g1_i3.p1  ORF type:complete len:196 (+),score=10.73 TRINITY_DN11300_c0_g1_i3:405-992(+)